jgi:hypothetical protein
VYEDRLGETEFSSNNLFLDMRELGSQRQRDNRDVKIL